MEWRRRGRNPLEQEIEEDYRENNFNKVSPEKRDIVKIRSSTYGRNPEWTADELLALQIAQCEAQAEYKKRFLNQISSEKRGSGKIRSSTYRQITEWTEDELIAFQTSQCEEEAAYRENNLNQVKREKRDSEKIRSSTYRQSPDWTEDELIAFETSQCEAKAEYKEHFLNQISSEKRGSGKEEEAAYRIRSSTYRQSPDWTEDELIAFQTSQCEEEAEYRENNLNQVKCVKRDSGKEAEKEYRENFPKKFTPEKGGSEKNIEYWGVPVKPNKIDKGKERESIGNRMITELSQESRKKSLRFSKEELKRFEKCGYFTTPVGSSSGMIRSSTYRQITEWTEDELIAFQTSQCEEEAAYRENNLNQVKREKRDSEKIRSSTYRQSPDWTEDELIAFETSQCEAKAEYKEHFLNQISSEKRGSGKEEEAAYRIRSSTYRQSPDWTEDELIAFQTSQCEEEAEYRENNLNQVKCVKRDSGKEAEKEYRENFPKKFTPEKGGSEKNIEKWGVPVKPNKIDKGKELKRFEKCGYFTTPVGSSSGMELGLLRKTLIPEISSNWRGKETETTEEEEEDSKHSSTPVTPTESDGEEEEVTEVQVCSVTSK
ncbi:hypothetical protein TNCT_145581 [Trichonephila clavata]|uniref:Uncharacterized protein n=1 Tax=Trichonephila clavata TaxID=2740835 RepID=A0A8X6GQF9_TRICU|nr:hypothetical protein TNCT_145581 [Trichonephila clavata]